MPASLRTALALGAGALMLPLVAPGAQTDYYNTDAGRPLQIEDAHPIERRAFEIQAAPVRLERSRGGIYHWAIEPELAYGILPRTSIEVGLPFAFIDLGGSERTAGLAGVHLSVFHNLNAETAIPALAIAGTVLLPAGPLAADETWGSVKGIATRTFTWARIHMNGEYTVGSWIDDGASPAAEEISRWMAGIAVDRAMPLASLLLTAEVYARQPIHEDEDLEWNTGVGARWQVGPRTAIDGGIGRRLTGDDRSWHLTFGAAWAVGLPWRP